MIGEKEVTGSSGPVNFSLSPTQPWPAGNYKVELFLNDELKQTLDFTVEVDEAALAPEPTPEPTEEPTEEPTATPEPTEEPTEEPTATPEPTEEPTEEAVSSSGDTLATEGSEEGTEEGSEEAAAAEEEAADDPEPLPFQEEPYVHPSGAFTFIVPEAWELSSEDETSAVWAGEGAEVGTVFTNVGLELTNKQMQDYIDTFIENFLPYYGDDYQIIEQTVQPDDSIYVSVSYSSENGDGYVDFFFEQRETVVFVLFFATTNWDELWTTWNEIIASYAVDPEAALAAAPAAATPAPQEPVATPTPAPPTATPAPAVDPLAPAAGRSRLWVFNEFGQELVFSINNQQHTIPTGGFDNMTAIDLDPGRYTYTISLPGGGAANGEVTMAANEAWAVGVRGDSAVYDPFKVYPQ
jgi:hypothetical protein